MIGSVSSSAFASQIASTLYSKLDTSNQGYFELSDLQTAFDNASTTSTNSSTSASDVFSQFDGNGDGKVTQDELTSSLQTLASELDSQYNSMRMNGMGGDGQGGMSAMNGMPPPPPPPSDSSSSDSGSSDSAGFTKDELQSQLDSIGSTDSKRSSLISSIIDNFSTADTNGDGEVSRSEAMAYDQSASTDTTAASAGTTTSDSSSSTSTASTSDFDVMRMIMQLMRSYGQDSMTSSSTLSTTA